MADSIERIADGLTGLAAVIRKHGTCAPAALDVLAARLRALSPRVTPEMITEQRRALDELEQINARLSALAKLVEIMEKAQEFASTWSLVGGKFDDGTLFAASQERKEELRALVRAALASPTELGGVECTQLRPGAICLTPQSCKQNGCDVVERESYSPTTGETHKFLMVASTPRAAEADDLLNLQRFAAAIIGDEIGDVDGFDIQDTAERCGLLIPTEVTERCHEEFCKCAEYGDFPLTCFRHSATLIRAYKAEASLTPPSAKGE